MRVCRVSDDEELEGQSKEIIGLVLVLVEVAEIEPNPPNSLEYYDNINYY